MTLGNKAFENSVGKGEILVACIFSFSLNVLYFINSLPHSNIFRLVQIQGICRRQNKFGLEIETIYGRVENIVGKGENAYQHFLFFPQCF